MQPTPGKTTQTIPVSIYPPIALERSLKLFGKSFKVHISTGLTFSPDTLLQVTTGMSLLNWMRIADKDAYQTQKALLRGVTGKHKLSGTTQLLIKQKFGGFFPSMALNEAMNGKELTTDLPWESDWEALKKSMGEGGEDDLVCILVARFAQIDRLAWTAKQLHDTGAVNDGIALLSPYIGNTLEAWKQYNPDLLLPVAPLVDIGLQTLVWLELGNSSNRPLERASMVFPLLASGKKPIGHWLVKIQKIAKCNSLNELSVLMSKKGIKLRDDCVTHDLLKKWSSGSQLMPNNGRDCLLNAVDGKVNEEHEQSWFATARFLSFLCDLVIAGTRGNSPSWTAAQDQIFKRYKELYDLESASRSEAG